MLSCRNQWGVSAFYIYGAYSIVDNGQDSMTRKFFKVYVLLEILSLPFVGKFFCFHTGHTPVSPRQSAFEVVSCVHRLPDKSLAMSWSFHVTNQSRTSSYVQNAKGDEDRRKQYHDYF